MSRIDNSPGGSDALRCECAVVGIFNFADAAHAARDALYQMQHRGQEQTGIAAGSTEPGKRLHIVKKTGWVREAYGADDLRILTGEIAIGHNRYSTAGPSDEANAQPHLVSGVPLAFCSNGDIIKSSYAEWRTYLVSKGMYFASDNDGELLAKLLAYHLQQGESAVQAVQWIMHNVVGAYSAVFIFEGKMYAFRDPRGMRPLVLGKRDQSYIVASETCGLNILLADYQREVMPGELVVFEKGHRPKTHILASMPSAHCIFELIYFARPDSVVFGIPVSGFRQETGELLSLRDKREGFAGADVVIPVPDSSNQTALGYHAESGIPFAFGLVRNHYVGRTFIEPEQRMRDDGVRRKFNPDRSIVSGKRVIVVDDSIVRGSTTHKIVSMLCSAGAREVHLRIGSPPIVHPCYYGIDTPDEGQLIAAQLKREQAICKKVGADSLRYVSINDLQVVLRRFGAVAKDFCYACFNGNYPTEV